MLLLWALLASTLLFLWIFSLPLLMIGVLALVPFCLVLAPISIFITTIVYFYMHPIQESRIREVFASAPVEYWFGRVEVDIPKGNYLICCHPHGIICTVALFGIHFRPKSKTLIAVAPIVFAVPVIGWLAKHLGAIPATHFAIKKGLEHTSVILMPGGVPEIVTYEKNDHYIQRWGFLKCARDTGCKILRITTNRRYYSSLLLPLYDFRLFIATKFNIPLVFPWVFGWYGTWIPKPLPIEPITKIYQYDSDATLEENRRAYYDIVPP